MSAITLLNPKSNKFQVGSSGIAEITPELIAGAFAGHPRGAWYLARAKYLNDEWSIRELEDSVTVEIAGWKEAQKWRENHQRGDDILRRLVSVSVAIYLDPKICKRCKGRGSVLVQRLVVSCARCNGVGRERINGQHAANALKVDRANWSRTWKHRAAKITRLLRDWDSEIHHILWNVLASQQDVG